MDHDNSVHQARWLLGSVMGLWVTVALLGLLAS
jgi:hypothetical protein